MHRPAMGRCGGAGVSAAAHVPGGTACRRRPVRSRLCSSRHEAGAPCRRDPHGHRSGRHWPRRAPLRPGHRSCPARQAARAQRPCPACRHRISSASDRPSLSLGEEQDTCQPDPPGHTADPPYQLAQGLISAQTLPPPTVLSEITKVVQWRRFGAPRSGQDPGAAPAQAGQSCAVGSRGRRHAARDRPAAAAGRRLPVWTSGATCSPRATRPCSRPALCACGGRAARSPQSLWHPPVPRTMGTA